MFAKLRSWFQAPPSPLLCMRLGPEESQDNPLMVTLFPDLDGYLILDVDPILHLELLARKFELVEAL